MFIWDIKNLKSYAIDNIPSICNNVLIDYSTKFYNDIKSEYIDVPLKLRCGLARGRITSIGDGADYVGPCINIAARLQKLSKLDFAVLKKGFDLSPWLEGGKLKSKDPYIIKKTHLRGIGDELVYIKKRGYDELDPEEKKLFQDP